jgi:hypothetical protein
MESPWWQNPPTLGFIPTPPPSKGGALAPSVVSSDLAHMRAWEVGWGNVPLFFCGVLVRESRATSLAGARWGLSLVCTADPLVGPL